MERIFKILILFFLAFPLACNDARRENSEMDNEDSKEVAEEANDEKFDDSKEEKDADFVANTVASNYGEITFAQLANQKSSNPEVKKIATQLINDHTKTLNELKTLAQAKSITIPVEEDDAARRKTEQYNDETGKDFDKKWAKEMIDRHEESINKFEKRLDKTQDPELKAFINKTLPHLRTHLEKLNACHDKLKDTNT
jgi:putative membrane protein